MALSCVELEADRSEAGPASEDAGSVESEPLVELDPPTPPTPPTPEASAARRTRGPWLGDADDVGRRYPAFGVTQYHMAHVYEAPKRGARAVGYLRRGARFRASEEVNRKDCARGWFEV